MLPEYDFGGALRGKYYERYQKGTNVVLLGRTSITSMTIEAVPFQIERLVEHVVSVQHGRFPAPPTWSPTSEAGWARLRPASSVPRLRSAPA
jgi:hypothetical protein